MAEDRDLHECEIEYSTAPEAAWEAYLDELRYVLDDVELLLENYDANRVVITADHGEAFGEYGIFGHPIGSLHPKVRTVPWAVTSATDTRTYEPNTAPPSTREEATSQNAEETLEALGYKF
jgi:hypothetical protein